MTSQPHRAQFSGTLSDFELERAQQNKIPQGEPKQTNLQQEEPELVAALRRRRHGASADEDMTSLLDESTVVIELTRGPDGQHLVSSYPTQRGPWLPVFTSLEQLAAFSAASGRDAETVTYGQLTGTELVRECLPELPEGTGIVFDPAADHALALPPAGGSDD